MGDVIDLTEYRRLRTLEKTWPPLDDLEYWRRRLAEKRKRAGKDKPTPPKFRPGGRRA